MSRKEQFVVDEYYHVYSRTILGVPEFQDSNNAKRLTQALLLGNSTESSRAFEYLRTDRSPKFETAMEISKEGEKFVDVLCYSVMPDHYHLLIKQRREKGITDFIRRCNISISNYINKKQDRTGTLFNGRFKSKHVNSNEYLLHLSVYIHLNILDIISGRDWREHSLEKWNEVKDELIMYPWSSLRFYLDEAHNDLIVSGNEIIMDQFNDRKEYERFLQDWAEPEREDLKKLFID